MIGIGEMDEPGARLEVAVIPPIQDQPCAWSLTNQPGKDVKNRAFFLRERRQHKLAHVQPKTILGKYRIKCVAERDKLGLDAIELWYAAQSGERVGKQSLA